MDEKKFSNLTLALCYTLAGSWVLDKTIEKDISMEEKDAIEYEKTKIHHCSPQCGIDWFLVNYGGSSLFETKHLFQNIKINKKIKLKFLLVEIIDNEIYPEYEKSDGVDDATLDTVGENQMCRKSKVKEVREAYLETIDYIVENANKYNIEIMEG